MTGAKPGMTQTDVVSALRDAYGRLDAVLERLSPSQMDGPYVFDDWTVKDILAHLSAWEQLELGWIEAVSRGEAPLLYAPGYEQDKTDWRKRVEAIDRFNAHILAQNKSRSFDDVLAEFRATQQRMLNAVSHMPERALTDPGVLYWIAVEVERADWKPIPVNSYEHYFEHSDRLATWLKEQQP